MGLIRRDDSALLVVDTQEGFYGPEREDVDRPAFELAVARVAWIAGLARALDVPIVVTEEDPETNGPTSPSVLARLPASAAVLVKPVFAAADNPPIRAALEATGRHTVVTVGLETDVCVAHSALTLLDRGWRVVCVGDAVASPGSAHEAGLERMRTAGARVLCAKQVHYEWLRTVAAARAFRAAHPELTEPPGVLL